MSFNPDVIAGKRRSPAGAIGIAQFMPSTWNTWGQGGDPTNPADAIPAQARYMCALAKAVKSYGGDQHALMLAGYNAGMGAVKKYGAVPNYRETKTYIARIQALLNDSAQCCATG